MSAALKKQQEANNAEMVATLQMCQTRLANKIAASSEAIKTAAFEDTSLPILAVVDMTEKYFAHCTNKPSNEVSSAIDEVLSGKFLEGLKNMISVGLNELLGNTSAGETEKKSFHIVFANNSLLRIDYMMFKYEFGSKGLQDITKNMFCYYLQVGVVDFEKTNAQILLYELTKSIGEDNLAAASKELSELAEFSGQLCKAIGEMSTATTSETRNFMLASMPAASLDDEEMKRRKKNVLLRYTKQKHAPFLVASHDGAQEPDDGVQEPVDGVQEPVDEVQEPVDGVQEPVDGVQEPVDGVQEPDDGAQD